MKLTPKQLSKLTGRSIATIENWTYGKVKMPEHIACIKEEIEKFIDEKKREIKEFEDGHKWTSTQEFNWETRKRRF